jgi:RNA polymerase sigma-70 factor (ECF subfamily)
VDGLTIDEIGALYRVHRATAARWLARAQVGLTKEIRAALIRTLNLQPAELRSVLRLIRSGLQVSLRSLFDGWQPPEPFHGATCA